jgi:hypothetical protein
MCTPSLKRGWQFSECRVRSRNQRSQGLKLRNLNDSQQTILNFFQLLSPSLQRLLRVIVLPVLVLEALSLVLQKFELNFKLVAPLVKTICL